MQLGIRKQRGEKAMSGKLLTGCHGGSIMLESYWRKLRAYEVYSSPPGMGREDAKTLAADS